MGTVRVMLGGIGMEFLPAMPVMLLVLSALGLLLVIASVWSTQLR